jgi:hypothetical protein
VAGIRRLREAGVPVEINYFPTRFNVHEIAAAVDLAHERGAAGRTRGCRSRCCRQPSSDPGIFRSAITLFTHRYIQCELRRCVRTPLAHEAGGGELGTVVTDPRSGARTICRKSWSARRMASSAAMRQQLVLTQEGQHLVLEPSYAGSSPGKKLGG